MQSAVKEMQRRAREPNAHVGIFGGLLGFGWVLAHLESAGLLASQELDLTDVDDLADSILEHSAASGCFDLTRGIVGMGVYARERLRVCPEYDRTVRILAVLDALASTSADGAYWYCDPHLLFPATRARYPSGAYDLGLAHGIAGVLALVARLAFSNIDLAGTLLKHGCDWLTSAKRAFPDGSHFPSFLDRFGNDSGGTRLAWCYGDLGTAAALRDAAIVLQDSELARMAVDIALECSERTGPSIRIYDASLCHGSQGAAHIFARFYEVTADERFRSAAERWTAQTLEFLTSGSADEALVGFLTHSGPTGQTWVPRDSVLEGSAGVGLSLHYLAGLSLPNWDRLLLVDPLRNPLTGADNSDD
jgi:lantibiotic biosynthesis protein